MIESVMISFLFIVLLMAICGMALLYTNLYIEYMKLKEVKKCK